MTTLTAHDEPSAVGEQLTLPVDVTTRITRVQRRPGWAAINFRELWEFRELLGLLVWRDLKVRYRQTMLGVAWAVIQPIVMMVVFTLLFHRGAGIDSDEAPYPILIFAALLPWQLFAYALNQSSNSLVNSANLLTKVYFPRLLVPASSILSGLADFAIALVVLMAMMAWYRILPTVAVLALPLFVLWTLAAALAVGLWLAALNVQFRDVRYVLPFLTQVWFFVTPVAYPIASVPERWRFLYGLNPMAGIVQAFRWALYGASPPGAELIASIAATAILLVSGVFYFRRMEKTFADVV